MESRTMVNYTVIAKGEYPYEQTNEVLRVERFLIVRRKTRRILLLDLHNLSKEKLTALRFQIDQYDARGNALGAKTVELKKLSEKSGKFVLKKEIELHRSCIDFRVKVLCATYGEYSYRLGEKDTYITYEKVKKRPVANKQAIREELGDEGFSAKTKKRRAPLFVGVFIAIVLVASGVLSYLHLREFTDGRNHFFLSNIKYEYTEEEITDETPLRVVGYIGLGGDKITVPNTIEGHPVTSIKAGAFEGNTVIKQLTVQSGVVIEEDAFFSCDKLEKVVLEGESFVGTRAFYDCDALKSVTAENLYTIGENAFAECGNLRSVRIVSADNDELMTVGENAFAECGDLDELYIDRYVAYPTACTYFSGTTSVKSLYLRNYNSVMYEGEGNTNKKLNELFGGEGTEISVETLRIAHTDGIPEYFMQYATEDLQSFTVDTLKSSEIGAYAFTDCGKLTQFSLPKLVSSVGAHAFEGAGILSFDGSALTAMGANAFADCLNLKEFHFQPTTLLTELPDGAFAYSSALKSIFIPSAVTGIGYSTFTGCSSLFSLTFAEGSKLMALGESAFSECTGLRKVILPDGLRTVGNKAFESCKALRYLSIPASVTSLGSGLFDSCYKLYEIENLCDIAITAGSGLGYYTLKVYTDTEENEPRIPKHTMGDYVIADVDGVHYLIEYEGKGGEITLPEGVDDTPYILTSYLFIETTHVTGVKIPVWVEKIGRWSFMESKISSVKFTSGENEIALDRESFANCQSIKSVDFGTRNIPVIEDWMFKGCAKLERLGLSDKTTHIAPVAFSGFSALARVNGGSAVESIGAEAFSDCKKLVSYQFSNSLLTIGDSAFENCSGLESFLNAGAIQSIGNCAFKNCTALAHISLVDTLTEIGNSAFEGCTAIGAVSGANQLTHLPAGVFANCTGLTSVALPAQLIRVCENAFKGCTRLNTLTGGENLEYIEPYAFYQTAIRSYTMPSMLDTVGEHAFAENTALETLTGGENLLDIQSYAFSGCTALKTFDIPRGLFHIYEGAFKGCTSLVKLTGRGGSALLSIGNDAFSDCTALEVVYLPHSLYEIGNNAFWNCPVLHEVYDLSSSISVVPNSTDNGWVGYNALVVHTYEEDIAMQKLTRGDYTFKYYRGTYTLTKYTGNATTLSLDSVQEINKYAIARYAFNGNAQLKTLTVTNAVDSARSQAFLNLSNLQEIRFADGAEIDLVDGTFDGCNALRSVVIPDSLPIVAGGAFGGRWLNYYSRNADTHNQYNLSGAWYYYDECIHHNEPQPKWNYVNGVINTSHKSYDSSEVTLAPTCTLNGWKKNYCSNCDDYEEGIYVPPKGHSYSEGVCKNCGHINTMKVNKTTYSTAKTLLTVSQTGSWDIFQSNATEIRSADTNGTVTLTIRAIEAVTIDLTLGLIGEDCGLSYEIRNVGGYVAQSGALDSKGRTEQGLGYYLGANYTLTITFTKQPIVEIQENEDGTLSEIIKENPAYAVISAMQITQANDPSSRR